MVDNIFYKTRLRHKGQITVPLEVRTALGAEEGDDLVFQTDEQGRVIVSRALLITPDQAWFWNARWQRLEHETQADIYSGKVKHFDSVKQALDFLEQIKGPDAED